MNISRTPTLGLVLFFASACTVVVQPAADQPRPAPSATEDDSNVEVVNPEPARRPAVQVPRNRPSNPDRDPGYDEPDSPSRPSSPRSNRLNLGVPPGHLPGPGECRVWVHGLAPGQQERSRSCSGILATAPPGSWILYRPAQYQRQVRVRYLHATRQMVIAVRAFDIETGAYLRDYALEEDDNNMASVPVAVRRPNARASGERVGDRGNSDNAPGRISTSGDRGNSGNAPGRIGSARDTSASEVNNGVAVGRRDNPRTEASNARIRGDQGEDNRSTNANDNAADQGRRKPPVVADSSGGGRAAGEVAVRSDNSASSRRGTNGGIRGTARQADSSRTEDPDIGVEGAVAVGRREAEPPNPQPRGERLDDVPSDTVAHGGLGIHPRFLPRAGRCRVWVPNLPYGRQATEASCGGIVESAPAGAWILRRSIDEPDVIRVDYVDEENPGLIVRTNRFDVNSGAVLETKHRDH